MSKYKQAKGTELDYILYRLDHIERRLDNLEQSNKGNVTSEILHVLLDMVKQQNGKQQAKIEVDSKQDSNIVEQSPENLSSFDTVSCMARRRTII